MQERLCRWTDHGFKIQYCCHSFIFFSKKQKPLGHIKTNFENQRSDPAKPFWSRQVLGSTLGDFKGLVLSTKCARTTWAHGCRTSPSVGHLPVAPRWFLCGHAGSVWLWDSSGWKGPREVIAILPQAASLQRFLCRDVTHKTHKWWVDALTQRNSP